MDLFAAALWIMTALVGAYMFGITLRHRRPGSDAVSTRMPDAIFWHPVGAIAGFSLLVRHLNNGSPWAAWGAFGVLVCTAAFGEVFFLRWLRDRRRLAEPELLAEQQIPVIAVVTHGILATATLVATFIVALQA